MKDFKLDFNSEYAKSFLTFKRALIFAPIIHPPNWSVPFEIMCGTSNYAIGIMLGQKKDKKLHTIYYAIRTLDA